MRVKRRQHLSKLQREAAQHQGSPRKWVGARRTAAASQQDVPSASAAGYEVVRALHQHYSIVSRMEAVYVRDESLKLHSKCGHHKTSMDVRLDVLRYLEDELSKADSKLISFPEL